MLHTSLSRTLGRAQVAQGLVHRVEEVATLRATINDACVVISKDETALAKHLAKLHQDAARDMKRERRARSTTHSVQTYTSDSSLGNRRMPAVACRVTGVLAICSAGMWVTGLGDICQAKICQHARCDAARTSKVKQLLHRLSSLGRLIGVV